MKKILSFFISIYCILVASVGMSVIMLVTIALSHFKSSEKLDILLKKYFRAFFKILFIKVEINGIEKLDKNSAYVFIPNHLSFFDGFALHAFLPNYLRGIEIDFHFKWFIYGKFLTLAGNIPINPNNIKSSFASIKKAAEIMKTGKSFVIFPEGERSKSGKLGEFKRLPFLLALEAKAPIIPIGLIGFQELMPVGTWRISPRKVTVNIGEAINYEQITNIGNKEIVNYTRNKIQELIS